MTQLTEKEIAVNKEIREYLNKEGVPFLTLEEAGIAINLDLLSQEQYDTLLALHEKKKQ